MSNFDEVWYVDKHTLYSCVLCQYLSPLCLPARIVCHNFKISHFLILITPLRIIRPISWCVDLFAFVSVYFVFLFHTAYVLYYGEHGGLDLGWD